MENKINAHTESKVARLEAALAEAVAECGNLKKTIEHTIRDVKLWRDRYTAMRDGMAKLRGVVLMDMDGETDDTIALLQGYVELIDIYMGKP